MFDSRELSPALELVREQQAPDALVLDTKGDFETVPPAVVENLAPTVEAFDPSDCDPAWVPESAPEQLHRLAGGEFTVGAPGDGGVAWTRQTHPPTVFIKPRLEGSPDSFVDFLIAEALVEIGTDLPEMFLEFFGERYPKLAATGLSPADTYQLANAVYDAYIGLHTEPTFRAWGSKAPELTPLHDAWLDAGTRLSPRLEGLAGEVARGETSFAEAAELACSAVKHGIEPPTPFGALATQTYREHGSEFAVRWAEKTLERLT
jgi:hypothetical protein